MMSLSCFLSFLTCPVVVIVTGELGTESHRVLLHKPMSSLAYFYFLSIKRKSLVHNDEINPQIMN